MIERNASNLILSSEKEFCACEEGGVCLFRWRVKGRRGPDGEARRFFLSAEPDGGRGRDAAAKRLISADASRVIRRAKRFELGDPGPEFLCLAEESTNLLMDLAAERFGGLSCAMPEDIAYSLEGFLMTELARYYGLRSVYDGFAAQRFPENSGMRGPYGPWAPWNRVIVS